MKNSRRVDAPIKAGDYVRFAHLPPSMYPTPILVTEVTPRGLIRLLGWAGSFKAHLFVVVDGPKEAA